MADTVHVKGYSRIGVKQCHWCAKKQPADKPFAACSRCKEVIHCGKECQKLSWPFHKVGCNISVESRNQLHSTGGSDAVRELAGFKKWHGIRHSQFRESIVHALNLGSNPSNAENKLLFIEVKRKVNHAALPPGDKFSLESGFDLTFAAALDMLSRQPQAIARFNDLKAKHEHMKAKGGLGMSILLLKSGPMVDTIDVILPTLQNARNAEKNDLWGSEWLVRLAMLLELPMPTSQDLTLS